jgi:hypothetical protein
LDNQPLPRDPHLPALAEWCLAAMSEPTPPPPPHHP